MNKNSMRIVQILVLIGICNSCQNSSAMDNHPDEIMIRNCAITGGATLATSLLFSHVLWPIITGHRKKVECERRLQEHAEMQIKLRTGYHDIKGKYDTSAVPSDLKSLRMYKDIVATDKVELNKMLSFAWDSPVEKEVVINLVRQLDGLERQVDRLIVSTTVQDIKRDYKHELELVRSAGSRLDVQTMNKIVFEKYGHVQYRFGSYKSDLSQKIAYCKNIGATYEEIDELDMLDKLTNSLFSQFLDNERIVREKATREQRLFDAEVDNKLAVKDFYKEAQHHVANASRTVERFSKEMDAQCKQQLSAIEKCSRLLNSLSSLISNWSGRIDQQTERIVYETRQEGRTTREAVQSEAQATRANISQVGHKVDRACDRAHAAQQQTAQSVHHVAQAPRLVVHGQQEVVTAPRHSASTAPQALPIPSAPPLPSAPPVPSAPPIEQVSQNKVQGECPVCLDTKPLISFGACRHEICPHCKEQVRKLSNNTCPLCRGPIGGDNFPLRK